MLGAGGFPASPLGAELCLRPQGLGGRLEPRAPLLEPPTCPPTPAAPALWHSRRRGAERQLSCSHFLIVVFEALGSRAERLTVPVLRLPEEEGGAVADDEGGATLRRGGEGALGGGAAGPAAARECGAPAPCAAGPGDEPASQPASQLAVPPERVAAACFFARPDRGRTPWRESPRRASFDSGWGKSGLRAPAPRHSPLAREGSRI